MNISSKHAAHISKIECLKTIDSTNQYLLDLKTAKSGHVCLAEHQTAGRGRRGRQWHSPCGGNVYLSILWQFKKDPAALSGLSLAVGVAILRALRRYGIKGLQLKWPNDVLYQGRKLAGTLIELAANRSDGVKAVIGIGLNVVMPGKEWIDVSTIIGHQPERDKLVSFLLDELVGVLCEFNAQGLAPFLTEYHHHDVLVDQPVKLLLPAGDVHGVVKGVGEQGELLLENDEGESQSFVQGEVSVRLL